MQTPVVVVLGLAVQRACEIFHRFRIKPMSSAVTGRFFTTGSTREASDPHFKCFCPKRVP